MDSILQVKSKEEASVRPTLPMLTEAEVVGRWFNSTRAVEYTNIESGGKGFGGTVSWVNLSGKTIPAKVGSRFNWTIDSSGVRIKWIDGDYNGMEGLIPSEDFKTMIRK